jgi:beta-1,4-N-acetylglucosaminyltransferase
MTHPKDLRDPVDVLLVCSSGGHLLQLWSLRPAWEGYARAWVVASHEGSDVTSLLEGEKYAFCYSPTTRSLRNLVRNTVLAWRLLGRLRPSVVVTTGAAIAVPFAWVARARGIRTVYVESLARSERPSLSCRLVSPAVDRLYVQWPQLARTLPGARYAGTIFGGR